MFQGEAIDIKLVYYDGKSAVYLDDFVKSIVWSGDVTQAARRLDVELNATINGDARLYPLENGKEIRFYNGKTELFRGFIFTNEIDTDGQARITAYDEAIYLVKNVDTRVYRKMTASAIIRKLCAEFGIATGTIVDTGYVIPKMILRKKTLWDMILMALTETRKQTGKRFFVYAAEGKLHVVQRKDQVVRWVIERGNNMISGTRVLSIEDLRNNITVIGGEDANPISSNARNADSIKKYGMMKHIERMDTDVTKSQTDQRAKQLLSEMNREHEDISVEALGIDDVFAGRAVYMRDAMTGLIGGFYVATDSHRFERGTHIMSLTLTRTDELPTLEYEEPKEVTSSSGGNSRSKIEGKASGTAAEVISIAESYVGKTRYNMGWGRTESDRRNNKFDCSSFVKHVFAKAGVNIGGPFSGVTTDTLAKEGRAISVNDLRPGDLVFANTYKHNGHVLIYIGDGKVIGCGRSGTRINKLSYWKSTYGLGSIRRVL
jgi:cell wall-associated NlpC family hydrolase